MRHTVHFIISGEYCATNIDECVSDPCLHGGKCTDDINGYTCKCPVQYLGDTCSHHVCDDDQSACLDGGECYVQDGKAMCLCPAAFSGDACETNKCDDITCFNGGNCENGTCECRPGFLGLFCSVDLCTVTACVNGATCDAGQCHCASGYSGVDCSVQVNPYDNNNIALNMAHMLLNSRSTRCTIKICIQNKCKKNL